MVLTKIFNGLRGNVRLRVTGGFPERVLNLCGARKLCFWDVCWISPTEFTCSMSRRDWRVLRQAAERLECAITPERRAGVPYFLGRFRKRYVLAAGLTLCVLGLVFGSFFIWDFRIDGNETIPDEEILRALQRHGITLGTFGFAIDSEDLRNHLLPEMPELAWITVNVSGCQAQVQVLERIPAPELADQRTPCNIVARRDGLVREVRALGGAKQVLPGTVVQRGQLLISGVEDTGTVGARMMAGMGTVTARTWYTLTARIPLTENRRTGTPEERRVLSLIFGTRRVKICGNSSYSLADCDKIIERTQLRLFWLPLPVTVERETIRRYDTEPAALAPETARQRAEAALTEYLEALVAEHGSVTSTLCTARQSGGVLTVTLAAECAEQIGERVPIYTETAARAPQN
ncbi:sporulation protein YqfD [Dysosmobacter sp.]|uniref:sporulation protein YqfD n=1 Tax=Dysosmobacter sp. TaxID=2591382 RepID=UPI002A8EA5BE|nr:sporulation protein YqfD [Dysosmobacter sp.]MDY3281472.1 sporulation protein YqfD [Dysosmobacter sp.]